MKRKTRAGAKYAQHDWLPESVKTSAKRHFIQIFGFTLLITSTLIGIALMSWSVNDPSALNAVSGKVSNFLGRPGAVVADILMQIFGLSTIAMILTGSLMSLRLVREGKIPNEKAKIVAWLFGLVLAAGFASHLPTSTNWPLPTGFGGALGDSIQSIPHKIFGTQKWISLVSGLAMFVSALLLLSFAAGYGPKPAVENNRDYDEDMVENDDAPAQDDDDRLGWVSIGALVHVFYAIKSAFARAKRIIKFKTQEEDYEPYELSDVLRRAQDHEDSYTAENEKTFYHNDRPIKASVSNHLEERDDYNTSPLSSARVVPPTASIKAGQRSYREAQPSLLSHEEDTYELPPLALLAEPKKSSAPINTEALEQNARLLEGVLEDFGVKGEILQVRPGPVVTLYELEPAPGIKSSRVISLSEDIARSMSAVAARVAVVQGRNAIGIELPNSKRETVFLRELLAAEDFEKNKSKLPLCLGKTIGGEPVIADLSRMPHLLIAGTTGSGKSVAINTMILSLLYCLKPEECRLIMIDPKMLELSVYEGIPHLLTPVVTDPKKAVIALKWAVHEMEDRYKKMSKLGVRNIEGFNNRVKQAQASNEVISRTVQTGYDPETGEAIYEQEDMDLSPLPFIVVIVDEMADLMLVAGKDIEGAIQRLAQMARAAGIHLIMATQRPSVDVITGTIKANFPTRISFQVTSKIDSRTILGEQGAEQLLGQGDMLYMVGGGRINRVHGPYVSDNEVEKIVNHLKSQGQPDYLEAVTRDDSEEDESAGFPAGGVDEGSDLYTQAVSIVLRDGKASTSYVQRRLQIGYNRAASLIERMEREGVISAPNHSGKREILLKAEGHAA